MNHHEAEIIKSLAELGIYDKELTPEQEQMLNRALDSEEQFLQDVEALFRNSNSPDPSSK